MPKKVKLNRSPVKRNQAFVQVKKCSYDGHKINDVFTREMDSFNEPRSVNTLVCNQRTTPLYGKCKEQAPFTLGMSNKPQEGWRML